MREDIGPDSTPDLVRVALGHADGDDARWQAVKALHWRGTPDVLEAALVLCQAGEADRRRLGADILGQLGSPARSYREQSEPLLLRMLGQEQDPGVLNSVAIALGHLGAEAAVQPMAALHRHPAAEVRFAVAAALPAVMSDRGGDVGVAALVELTSDRESDVRDWATFGLGSQLEADSPTVRDALVRRLQDPEDDVRVEALVGLARRGDRRTREPLLDALRQRPVHPLAVEAAEYLGDAAALPLLEALRAAPEEAPDRVERAIRCCDPEWRRLRAQLEARVVALLRRAVAAGVGGRELAAAGVELEASGADTWVSVGPLRWDLNEALDQSSGEEDRAVAAIVTDLARV
jgi:HEAT repeat protein